MVLHLFKKHTRTFLFLGILSIIVCLSTDCMNMSDVKDYFKTSVKTIISNDKILYPVILLSHMQNVYGYASETHSACLEACAQNCSTTTTPYDILCYPDEIIRTYICIVSSFFLAGTISGFWVRYQERKCEQSTE